MRLSITSVCWWSMPLRTHWSAAWCGNVFNCEIFIVDGTVITVGLCGNPQRPTGVVSLRNERNKKAARFQWRGRGMRDPPHCDSFGLDRECFPVCDSALISAPS